MKQRIKYIITTIIVIVVVVSSLTLPSSAAELKEYNIDAVTSFFRRYDGVNTNVTPLPTVSQSPTDNAIQITTEDFASVYDYSRFINFSYQETVTGVAERVAPYFQMYVVPTEFNNLQDKSGINYFEFNYGCIVGSGVASDSSLPFTPILFSINGEITNRITVTYNVSSPTVGSVTNASLSSSWSYRQVNCQVLFDEDFQFNNNDVLGITLRSRSIYVETPTSPAQPATVYYSLGISPLKVGYKTTDEYLAGISSSVNNIESTLMDISDSLSVGLTTEQQQAVDGLNAKIEDYHSKEETVNNDVSGYVDTYNSNPITFENSDFDIVLQNNYNNVFSDDGFLGFWNVLWYNPFVIAAMALVLVFATASYIIYGLR